jgi:hypothetical protein
VKLDYQIAKFILLSYHPIVIFPLRFSKQLVKNDEKTAVFKPKRKIATFFRQHLFKRINLGIQTMPNFETYVARHGESWVQHIVEMIERNEGIRYRMPVPLEDRWNALTDGGCAMPLRLAA